MCGTRATDQCLSVNKLNKVQKENNVCVQRSVSTWCTFCQPLKLRKLAGWVIWCSGDVLDVVAVLMACSQAWARHRWVRVLRSGAFCRASDRWTARATLTT